MKDNRKNPWYYLLLVTLGVIVGGTVGYYAFGSPKVGGAIGAGLLIVGFLAFGGPAKPTSAY